MMGGEAYRRFHPPVNPLAAPEEHFTPAALRFRSPAAMFLPFPTGSGETAVTRPWVILTILCLPLIFAGCGYYRWQKQGASSDDFKADQAACEQSGTSGMAFNSCMQQRGWSYVD
jgi:hypothetical protein